MADIENMVSVVVPVYNSQMYIADTIKSVLGQTYRDIELVLVVDGATDGSYEICLDFAARDTRVKVFFQKNKGISAARNKGIMSSTGKYIMFVDHDDTINENLIRSAVDGIRFTNSDILKFGYDSVNIDSLGKTKTKVPRYKETVYSFDDYKREYIDILDQNADMFIWDAIYSREYLINNRILFDESFKIGGEDTAFNITLLKFSHRICYLSGVFYHHFNRYDQSTSLLALKNLDDYVSLKIKHLELCNEVYFSVLDDAGSCYEFFLSRLIGSVISKYIKLCREGNAKDYISRCNEINNTILWDRIDISSVIRNNRIAYWRRIVLVLFRHHFYKALLWIYQLHE